MSMDKLEEIVNEIGECMERVYALDPSLRPREKSEDIKKRGAVKLGGIDGAISEALGEAMSKSKIDNVQKLDRKELMNVNLKNILKEFPLETELEQGQKVYIGIRDNEIVLEFWEVVQNFEETDWENINTYSLKLQ